MGLLVLAARVFIGRGGMEEIGITSIGSVLTGLVEVGVLKEAIDGGFEETIVEESILQ